MKAQQWILAALLGSVGSTGCIDKTKEAELKKEIVDLTQTNDALLRDISRRDSYIEEIVSSINKVYNDLEVAQAKERKVVKQAQSMEKQKLLSNMEVRQQVVQHLAEINNSLRESRKRITGLESRVRSSEKQFGSLEEMVSNLRRSLEERELTIAKLEFGMKELAGEVEAKTSEIARRDGTIRAQQMEMNTTYFVVGTRKELEEKGIIRSEGGFLWGLLGSTTVLASGVNQSYFRPLDKTNENTLTVEGEIDEIIPKRNQEFYETNSDEQQKFTTVKIVDTQRFWQDRYLVIITG